MESSQLFYIERQESLAQDKFNKNGRTMDLHIVAKNIAFVVHIGASFDLNQSPPTAKLVYDFTNADEEEKEVEAMKSVPMEFIAHVDETGFKAAVEVKIAVLSSQHEGAYFRVKFSAVDPLSHTLLEEYSQPIKVMSKQNQVKKMMERKTNKRVGGEAPVSPDGDGLFTPPAPSAPKRSLSVASNDAMLEAISRLEEQQREQTKMLQALLSQGSSRDPQPIRQPVSVPDPDDMDFETAFLAFLKAYKKVPQEERASKIRKVVQTAGETDNLSEIVGLYSLTQSSDVAGKCSESNCRCEECPHKRQLSRLDDFFHDFLSDPLSPEAL